MADKHPGFKGAQQQIAAKEGVSQQAAGAILGKSTRDASPAAKKANPRLRRVKPAKGGPSSKAKGIMQDMLSGGQDNC